MDRDFVITKLREHEPELKAAGIVHLRLHGSLTRGAATATPDVDLIAESTPRNSPCSIWTLKEPVAERAAPEAVRAF